MEFFVCVSSRFLFYNGSKRYTVEFVYSIMKWFIFNEEEHSDAVFSKEINPKKNVTPNREQAEIVLYEYLHK